MNYYFQHGAWALIFVWFLLDKSASNEIDTAP